jgi:hypothetical protein
MFKWLLNRNNVKLKIFFINDGSTNNITKYTKNNIHILVLCQEMGRPLEKRNIGVKYSKGITFISLKEI